MSPWMLEARRALRAWRPASRAVAATLFVQPAGTWQLHGSVPATAHDSVADWCRQHPGSSLRVLVSGHLTHQLCVNDPSLPLHSEADVQAWARHQWQHYHGSVAEHWPMVAWCRGDERGASALHGLDLAALRQVAQAHQVSLLAVDPWWTAALRRLSLLRPAWGQGQRATLWLVEGALCTAVQVAAGRVLDLSTRWLEAANAEALAERLLEPGDGDALLPGDLLMGYGIDGEARLPAVIQGARMGTLAGACPAPMEVLP